MDPIMEMDYYCALQDLQGLDMGAMESAGIPKIREVINKVLRFFYRMLDKIGSTIREIVRKLRMKFKLGQNYYIALDQKKYIHEYMDTIEYAVDVICNIPSFSFEDTPRYLESQTEKFNSYKSKIENAAKRVKETYSHDPGHWLVDDGEREGWTKFEFDRIIDRLNSLGQKAYDKISIIRRRLTDLQRTSELFASQTDPEALEQRSALARCCNAMYDVLFPTEDIAAKINSLMMRLDSIGRQNDSSRKTTDTYRTYKA